MSLDVHLSPEWREVLGEEIKKKYFQELMKFLEREEAVFFPKKEDVFKAFELTPYEKVKVCIVGQDPYHGENEATGLAFSVNDGVRVPPSLRNIFKEIESDLGIKRKKSSLDGLAKQGVFLLNATLTVKKDAPLSHKGIGWETFTDKVIEKIAEKKEPVVFLLWGKKAEEKAKKILKKKNNPHLILKASHPSFFSVKNFFGCKHFSKANEFLEKAGREKVDWSL